MMRFSKIHFLVILMLYVLTGCNRQEGEGLVPDINLGTEMLKDAVRENTQADQPIVIPNSDYLMIPLSRAANYERSLHKTSVSYDAVDYMQLPLVDLLFYNPQSGQSHLLLADTNRVLLNYYLPDDSAQQRPKGKLFFELVTGDFNSDKKMNNDDPVQLCMTDSAGKNRISLTPADAHCDSWRYYKKQNIILAYVHYDSDKNKRFNRKDAMDVLRIDLNAPAMGKSIFAGETKSYLQKQLGLIIP